MKWIKCSESLPKVGLEVNVLVNYKGNSKVTSLSRLQTSRELPDDIYFWDNYYSGNNCHAKEAITHWQPLPKPPKETE